LISSVEKYLSTKTRRINMLIKKKDFVDIVDNMRMRNFIISRNKNVFRAQKGQYVTGKKSGEIKN
jgi:hypothetical protein